MPISRRKMLSAAPGVLALLAMPAVRAQAPIKVRYAALSTGFSVIVDEFMSAKRFDLKHGVDMTSINSYVSVASYLNDFAAGTFDLAIAGWDSAAELHHRGVPIQFVSTLVTADMINMLATDGGAANLADLKGKSIAAVMASGTYQVAKVLIRATEKLELEKDITVQNVPSPAQVITMLMARNAPAGLAWEPNVSIGLARDKALKPIFNFGEAYRRTTNEDLPYFGIAAQRSMLKSAPDLPRRISAAFKDCVYAIRANPSEAIELAAKKLKVEPAILRTAFESKRLRFIGGRMEDRADRKLVENAAAFFLKNGAAWAKLDEGFFIS